MLNKKRLFPWNGNEEDRERDKIPYDQRLRELDEKKGERERERDGIINYSWRSLDFGRWNKGVVFRLSPLLSERVLSYNLLFAILGLN